MNRAAAAHPQPPEVESLGEHLFEVTKPTATARCHHTAHCLTPLRVGDLVIRADTGPFYALLEHDEGAPRAQLRLPLGLPTRL